MMRGHALRHIRQCCVIATLAGALPFPLLSQNAPVSEAPLSVIDWLDRQPAAYPDPGRAGTADPNEPPVADTGAVPQIETSVIGERAPRRIGLVPPDVTGLPPGLWQGSDAAAVTELLTTLPLPNLPAAQSLLYTVLLTEALGPGQSASAADMLALARVRKLVEAGALDPAASLIEQAGITLSPAHFDLWMEISLLNGTEDHACTVLQANPHLTRDYANRIFCAGRARQWDNAALTFGSAQALGLMPPEKLAVLDRFLHPESFEEAAPLPQPRDMDPMTFRLFETIGEPLPTGALSRAYAVADLRDLAGWKAQLEAAERLTRAGALPDNRLLGLYTERKAAASGGIWDRVAAVQRFDVALSTGSTDAVAKTLATAWKAMAEAGLEVSFASLFAERLAVYDLDGSAAALAGKIALLSPNYEAVAATATEPDFITGIATGQALGDRPTGNYQAAIYDAFSTAAPRSDLIALVRQNRLGEAILNCLKLLHRGVDGNQTALREGLATLRALGLEDTARRAALQILLREVS